MTRDSGDSYPHPAFFASLLQNKALSQFHAWVAPAWRLGGPWATLGPPKGHPISHPKALANLRRFVRANQVRKRTMSPAAGKDKRKKGKRKPGAIRGRIAARRAELLSPARQRWESVRRRTERCRACPERSRKGAAQDFACGPSAAFRPCKPKPGFAVSSCKGPVRARFWREWVKREPAAQEGSFSDASQPARLRGPDLLRSSRT